MNYSADGGGCMSEVYDYPTILLSDGTREFIGGGNGDYPYKESDAER